MKLLNKVRSWMNAHAEKEFTKFGELVGSLKPATRIYQLLDQDGDVWFTAGKESCERMARFYNEQDAADYGFYLEEIK